MAEAALVVEDDGAKLRESVAHPNDLLEGLSLALLDCDDQQLLDNLETVQAALRDTA